MPIQVQCCGLLLMIILVYFYRSQQTIKLNTEKAFWNSFCMTLFCVTFDILSCIAISLMDIIPIFWVNFISKTYLASLVGVSFFALLYICTDIYSKRLLFNKMLVRYGTIVLVAIILIYALPIEYYVDKDEGVLYSYGPSDYATYGFALATVIFLIVLLIKERKNISLVRRRAVQIWLGEWCLAAIIQFLNPKLLLISFASAVGMLVLYLKLENPGNNLDRKTGLFNNEAFLQYTKQLYAADIPFSILGITLERNSVKSVRAELEEAIIAETVSYLSGIPDALVFRNSSNSILMLYTDKEKAAEGIKAVRGRFEHGWGKNKGILVSPYWIYVSDSRVAGGTEELLYLMRYAQQNSQEFAEDHFYEVSRELALQLRLEKDVEKLIDDAIENDRVEVWYQPIYSTENHRFTSAEALVRLRNADGQLVQPGVFIEIAERNGKILQLGETVFRKVCAFLKESQLPLYGIDYIEVNLSVVQCAYKHLSMDYIKIIEENGISPKLINLEITESATMNSRNVLLENMSRLMDYGVSFSLDDFGTGHSNLDYIVDMPVEIVKFDKGMTTAYFENGKAKYIMDAAMNMIHGMDLKIVSEGIETEEQFCTMENLGINYIQGYYFSKPLPKDEFLEFIKTNNKKGY